MDMKRLIIICEGETEQEFCKEVLSPYFLEKNIYIQAPIIKKSNGGIVKWSELKKQIENHLKQDAEAKVTTLIDFYGIKAIHAYPKFYDASKSNKDKVVNIETGMKDEIGTAMGYRFIPYIQLHEFEALIFCSLDVMKNNFKEQEANFTELENIINSFPNPEDINDNPDTAPSKRLEKHIEGYNKPIYGACLTSEIGVKVLREKCPRFNSWIEKLEKI